tara:strand:- start:461 stop:589 length:129 start_codon:yes stop_codon:yes gene_type:complete
MPGNGRALRQNKRLIYRLALPLAAMATLKKSGAAKQSRLLIT